MPNNKIFHFEKFYNLSGHSFNLNVVADTEMNQVFYGQLPPFFRCVI